MPRIPRKWKDPNRPRRGSGAFMLYSNEVRSKVKAENPGAPFGEIARIIARMWSDLPFERKEHYNRLAEEDRQRYEQEVKDYVPPPVPKDKIKKFRDPAKPKRGMSAFMLFSNDIRAKVKADNPSLPFGDVAREITRIWKESPPEVHMKYSRLAEEDKARYAEQMAAYRPPPPMVEETRRRRKREPGLGEPKRAKSPFMMFCQIERPGLKESNPEARMADLTTALAERWRTMTDADKAPYVQLAVQDKLRYEAEMAEYRAYAAANAAAASAARPALPVGAGTMGGAVGMYSVAGLTARPVYRGLMHGMTYTGAYGADDSDSDEDDEDSDDEEGDVVDADGGADEGGMASALHHALGSAEVDVDDHFHALMHS